MQRFTDLRVWQRSHALALELYGLSKAFPGDERFGLVIHTLRVKVEAAA